MQHFINGVAIGSHADGNLIHGNTFDADGIHDGTLTGCQFFGEDPFYEFDGLPAFEGGFGMRVIGCKSFGWRFCKPMWRID